MKSGFSIWQDKNKKAKGAKSWRVSTPAALSLSGKAETVFFATKLEAEAFVRAEETRIHNDGNGGAELSRTQRELAAKAFSMIGNHLPNEDESILLQAVTELIKSRDRRGRSKTFKAAFEEWQAWNLSRTRKGKQTSEKYAIQVKYTLPRFEVLFDRMVCDITAADVEHALNVTVKPEKAHARNGLLRVLRAFFNWCQRPPNSLLDTVPIEASTMFADTKHTEIAILTPDEATRLLATCIQIDPELLGYYALALFAGIRPTDELLKLQWQHVFGGGSGQIHIPVEVSKTGRDRYIPIEETLSDWLRYIAPPQVGAVTPPRNHVVRRRKVQRSAGITPWPQDVMRHSYASYWMTIHRDEDRCRDAMGHSTKDMLVRHYRKHTTEVAAHAFWAVRPSTVLKVECLNVG